MATELDRLVVKMIGDASQYINELKRAADQTARLSDQVRQQSGLINKSLASIASSAQSAMVTLAALGSGSWLKGNLKFFGEMESLQLSLNAAIEANGQSAQKVRKDYDAFTDSVANQTTVFRTSIVDLLRYAEGMNVTGEAAMRAVKNAIALNAAKPDVGLRRAIRATAALEHGRTGPIARAIPDLGNIKNDSERAAAAQKTLAGDWQQAIEKANSLSGQITKLGNDLWWLTNRYGDVIAEGARPLVAWLREVIDWMTRSSDATKQWVATVMVVTSAVISLTAALKFGIPLVLSFLNPWLLVAGGVIAGVSMWVQSVGGLGKAFEKLKEYAEEFWKWVKPIKAAFEDVLGNVFKIIVKWVTKSGAVITNILKSLFGDFSWDDFREQVIDAIYYVEYLFENLDKVGKDTWELLKMYSTLAWAWVKLQAARVFDYIVYGFTKLLPAAVKYLGENMEAIIKVASDVVIDIALVQVNAISAIFATHDWQNAFMGIFKGFTNIGGKTLGAAADLGMALGDALDPRTWFVGLQGAAKGRILTAWKDMTSFNQDRFDQPNGPMESSLKAANNAKRIIEKILKNEYGFGKFQLPEFIPSELFNQLQEEFDALKGKTFEAWPDFVRRRLTEMGRPESEVNKAAEFAGGKISENLTKGAAKELKKFDNVLYGSAAHIRNLITYASKLSGMGTQERIVGKDKKYARTSPFEGGLFDVNQWQQMVTQDMVDTLGGTGPTMGELQGGKNVGKEWGWKVVRHAIDNNGKQIREILATDVSKDVAQALAKHVRHWQGGEVFAIGPGQPDPQKVIAGNLQNTGPPMAQIFAPGNIVTPEEQMKAALKSGWPEAWDQFDQKMSRLDIANIGAGEYIEPEKKKPDVDPNSLKDPVVISPETDDLLQGVFRTMREVLELMKARERSPAVDINTVEFKD